MIRREQYERLEEHLRTDGRSLIVMISAKLAV